MEQPTLYRKTLRMIKGGAARLDEANRVMDQASRRIDIHRERVRNKIKELISIEHVNVGG